MILFSVLLSSNLLGTAPKTKEVYDPIEVAITDEVSNIDEENENYLNNESSVQTIASTSSATWNMVNYNMQSHVRSFETFDSNSYYKRTPTPHLPSVSATSEEVVVLDEINGDESNIKEITIDGTTYLYTEPYFPNETSSSEEVVGYDGIYGEDDRTYVSDPKKWPYYATGKIVMTYENVYNYTLGEYKNRTFIGTGFLQGPNVLVTAGHCVYGDVTKDSVAYENNVFDPRFPDSIVFYPGLDGNDEISTTELYANALVININKEYYESTKSKDDWAVVELDWDIGYKTGWYGKIGNWYKKDYAITTFGYPGDKNGEMWQSVATVTELTDDGIYKLTNDLKGGQSGSGLHVSLDSGGYVCGIATFFSYYKDDDGNNVTLYTGGTQINTFMFHYMNSFVTNHNVVYEVATIHPSDYNFADAYPTDSSTATNFVTHNLDDISFRTRRYRTGYIQQEYIVMSCIKTDITEAWIEYEFDIPVYKIDVELTHWREYSNEWLDKDSGVSTLQLWHDDVWWNLFDEEGWVDYFDLLSDETALSRDRTNPTLYTIEFDDPVYGFRFYSSINSSRISSNNRGRVCIGDMTVYTYAS